MKPITIYTIGHSNHPEEVFLKLLQTHGIEVVADVRSRPYSRFVPHFNRNALTHLLQEAGIGYLFLGRELGGKPQDLGKSLASEAVWQYLRARPQFQEGLARLLEVGRASRVCVLCAEADPVRCHRGQLLAPELAAQGAKVVHILPDGALAPHKEFPPSPQPSQKRLF